MNTQCSNNIFLQKSKDKYNPDVDKKKGILEKTRKENIFKKNTVIYNPITNQIPENIRSHRDLELDKDATINNIDQLISKKQQERNALEEEFKLKNPKQKIIMTNNSTTDQPTTFTEMKKIQTDYQIHHNTKIETNKNKYDHIMKNLKDLGIINN
jgi:hypothetical protein